VSNAVPIYRSSRTGGEPILLGRCARVASGDGWVFLPNVSGRKASRKVWPTWADAIPRWARKQMMEAAQ
jgi:hypothetical protein